MTTGTLTMSDIAALANVRRPVVSVWRGRRVVAGQLLPFPSPVEQREGVEFFDADEVVEWLRTTGRGNNPQFEADAAAYVRPPDPSEAVGDPLAVAEALLCLKVLTDASLGELAAEEILDLADEYDPDDDFLYAEVDSAVGRLPELARYVDELTDAAYDAAGAWARLEAHRAALARRRRLDLMPGVASLVGEIGAALILELAPETATIVDAMAAGDLTVAVMEGLDESVDARVWVAGTSAAARGDKRSFLIHRWPMTLRVAGPALHLARFLGPGPDEADPGSLLSAVDDVQLRLTDHDRALVVGPASLLCDQLEAAEMEQQRDAVLRSGRLRLVVKLPRGLVVGNPRQALGLWAFGPRQDGIRLENRRLASADLSGTELSEDVIDDLVTDAVSVLATSPLAGAHAFRFARFTPLSTALAARGPLVATHGRAGLPAIIRPAEAVLAMRERTSTLDAVSEKPAHLAATINPRPSDRPIGAAAVSLGEMASSGRVQVVAGNRIGGDLATGGGTVALWTQADLEGGRRRRPLRVDPIAVEARHPGARRTEPGDVVFCTSPRPEALVDRDGLSYVGFPLRIIRRSDPSDRGLVPEAIAAAINELADSAKEWRLWPIPTVDPEDAAELTDALRLIEDECAKAERRLDQLDQLAHALVSGVSQRAITLNPPHPVEAQEGH